MGFVTARRSSPLAASCLPRLGRRGPKTVGWFGKNLDRLRKECGWSFNELAEQTGLEKKLILGHINRGKGIRPKTLKIYADAFGRKLERKVLVAELES